MISRVLRKHIFAVLLSLALFLPLILFLSSACAAGAPAGASLSVTSPREGETLVTGQAYTLTWTYTGDIGGYVLIHLYKGGKYNSTISSYTSAGSSGSGTYSWKVPSGLAEGDDYQVKVSSRYVSTVFAFSGTFAVRKTAPPEQPAPSTAPRTPPDVSRFPDSSQEDYSSPRSSGQEAPPAAQPPAAPSGPDLTITGIKMQPEPANLGATVTFYVTVKNAGSAACPAGGVVGVLSGGVAKTKTFSSLKSHSSTTVSVPGVTLPQVSKSEVTVWVETPSGTVDTNQSNNYQQYAPVTLRPDLTVTAITTQPSKAAPGTPVKVMVNVKNSGPGTCPAGATVKLTGSPGTLSIQTITTTIPKNSQKQVIFNDFPMPCNTTDLLVAQVSAPLDVIEVSTDNNTASLQPSLLLPTVQFVSLSPSGYWSAGGGRPALGDPIFFTATLKNTSDYQIINLPVQLSFQGQAIKTNYVNINPKSSATTVFDVVVHPGTLPPEQSTVTYTVTVNPPGPESLLISPATLCQSVTLEVLKTGTVWVATRQPDDSTFDEGGFTITCQAGSYYMQVNTGEATSAIFHGVPIGENLQVRATKPGFTGYNGQDTFSGILTSSYMAVKLYLTDTGCAAVTAQSQATGNFLSGVTVEVEGTGQQAMTTQDSPASFSLPSGTYTFRLSKRGFAPTTVTGTVTAGQVTELTGILSYTSTVTLTGRVVDQNGYPLAGQKVELLKWINNSTVTFATTDSNGNYSMIFDNGNVDAMYLKSVKGNATGKSEPECFYPGLRYRVDLVVAPPPPPPPASGWHAVKKKGCARAVAASVPDTFFTQGWDVSTVLGTFGIRLYYRNEYSEIAELKAELCSGPAAIYNVSTQYNGGEILGEAVAGVAQAAVPTLSDNAADVLSFLVEEYAPGITLSAEGGVGRTIVCLDRLEIIDRDSGQTLWSINSGFNTLDHGYSWTGRSYGTNGINWSQSVIRAYIYLDGSDMLGPQNERCKMVSWDLARNIVRYFNAPRNHPRFNVSD